MLPHEMRAARIKTATQKLLKTLRWQVVCSQKELERRVCEVGFRYYPRAPQEERPEPVHLNEARKRLVKKGDIDSVQRTIRGNTYHFYFLTDTDQTVVEAALRTKLAATNQFDLIHHSQELSGFATELMHWNAIGAVTDWHRMPLVMGQDVTRLNGHVADHGVDLAAVHMPQQLKVVASVKNTREWYYPNSHTVWELLLSAAQLDAAPVLLAPRIAEPTFLFMEDVGGFAVPAFNTYVHEDARARPDWAAFEQACEVLGYKDVKVMDPTAPDKRHVAPWADKLPARLPAMKATFDAVKDEVLRLGKDEGLAEQNVRMTLTSGEPRDEAFHAFWRSLKGDEEDDPGLHPSLF